MAKTKTYRQHMEEVQRFDREVREAVADGMEGILPDGSVIFDPATSIVTGDVGAEDVDNPLRQMNRHEAMKQRTLDANGIEMDSQQCGCDGRRGGLLTSNSAVMLDWSQECYIPVEGCGEKGLGYAVWGPGNTWPGMIFRTSASHPFTASVLDYLERTLFGLGPQVVYTLSRYSGGTVTHEEVPYEDAELYLKERRLQVLRKLEALTAELEADEEKGWPTNGQASQKKSRHKVYKEKMVEQYERMLEDADKELESYHQTKAELDAFLKRNNLAYFYKRWVADQVRLGICWPIIEIERGMAGRWDRHKVVNVDIKDSSVMRFEQRNPNNRLRIDNVYYSERWRDDANGKLLSADFVAYPALMPEHALEDMEAYCNRNARTKVGERMTTLCCPNYQPTPTKPYYPQMPWWSIFPSQIYQYSVTLIYDKNTERRNSTMWKKILFINTAYLAQIFAKNEKCKTPEGQAEVRRNIYKRVEDFMKNRDNNGKMLIMDSYPSADEKQMMDSIRIVNVPRDDNYKHGAEEIAEIASLTSYAFGVNMDLIGSRPGTQAKTTSSSQRELHLLKNGQMAPDRLTFTDFFNKFVFRNNGYDPHFKMVVNYPTLTTLDRSKTGIVTMSDEGE